MASISLKNSTLQGLALFGSFLSAAKLATIPAIGKPAAQATFKHLGTVGFWYITLKRTSGPTTTDYSFKLGPGDAQSEEDPPIGDIYVLADGSVDGSLSWYIGWDQ